MCVHHAISRTRWPVRTVDAFDRFTEDRFWNDTLEGYLKDERAVLELHKAARIGFYDSPVLQTQKLWTAEFLTQLALDHSSTSAPSRKSKYIVTQVNDVLNYPFHADVDLLAHQRRAQHYCYCTQKTKILKSSLRWLIEKKLEEMKLAMVKMSYCHFHGSATFTDPDHSVARILFSKHALIISLVDDLFDIIGTPHECLNLVHLLERWDVDGPKVKFCSDLVETLYWAIHGTICETVDKAFPLQGRSVMDHVVELWVEMLKGMFKESEWCRTNTVPTLDEYMANSPITLGVGGFLLPAMYLAGHELQDDVVRGQQFQGLFLLTTTIGRLLNDVRGFEREAEQGKVNAVSLRMTAGRGIAIEDSVEEVENLIKTLTRDMLRSATGEGDYNRVPKGVRDMFWKAVKGFFLFYMKEDLYHASTKLVEVVESVMNQPISVAAHDDDFN